MGAVVVNTSGGIVAGDHLDHRFTVGPGTEALITTQAAEKIYRSTGADSRLTVEIEVGDNAWLEWLPQDTIIFDGARLRRHTTLNVASTARVVTGEVLVFGRVARGENLTHGLVHDDWQVRLDGRLVWADRLHLAGALAATLASPTGFRGSKATATSIYIGPDAERWLEVARDLIHADGLWSGVTCIGSVLISRWLGVDAAAVRLSYAQFLTAFRSRVGNLPPRLPTIWNG